MISPSPNVTKEKDIMTKTQSLRMRQALPKVKELNDSKSLKSCTGGFLPFLMMLPFQIADDQAKKQAMNNNLKANGYKGSV